MYQYSFFWWDWSLNSGLHTCKTGAVPLKPHLQSILLWLFWRGGIGNYLTRLASPQSSQSQPPKHVGVQVRNSSVCYRLLFYCWRVFLMNKPLSVYLFTGWCNLPISFANFCEKSIWDLRGELELRWSHWVCGQFGDLFPIFFLGV
jgi:hypothetical protein